MPFIEATKNAMLDAITVDRIKLHDGAPGAAGNDNVVDFAAGGATYVAATFSAASSAARALATAREFTAAGLGLLDANQAVTYITFWEDDTTPILRASEAVTGVQAADGDGNYYVTTDTALTLPDPS